MLIPMSDRNINRFKVLQDVRERRLRQIDAADMLNISPRIDIVRTTWFNWCLSSFFSQYNKQALSFIRIKCSLFLLTDCPARSYCPRKDFLVITDPRLIDRA